MSLGTFNQFDLPVWDRFLSAVAEDPRSLQALTCSSRSLFSKIQEVHAHRQEFILPRRQWKHVAVRWLQHGVTTLKIPQNVSIGHARFLQHIIPHAQKLRHLDLRVTDLNTQDLALLAQFPKLETLSLCFSRKVNYEQLPALPQLQKLRIQGRIFSNRDVALVKARVEDLTASELGRNYVVLENRALMSELI